MTYGVLWSQNGEAASAGKLEVRPGSLVLEGTARGRKERAELRPEEVAGVHVGRSPAERLEGRPVLVLERSRGQAVRIAPIGAIGLLHELHDVVDSWRRDSRTASEPRERSVAAFPRPSRAKPAPCFSATPDGRRLPRPETSRNGKGEPQ